MLRTRCAPLTARALFWTVEAITLVLSLLCLLLPIARDLRVPYIECSVRELKLFPSYSLIVIGEFVGRLGGFLDVLFISWLFMR